jgi:hypothetical protein
MKTALLYKLCRNFLTSYLKVSLACVNKDICLHQACEAEDGANCLNTHDFHDINADLRRPLFQNIPEILPTHFYTKHHRSE